MFSCIEHRKIQRYFYFNETLFISCTERAKEIDLSIVLSSFFRRFAKFLKVAIGFVVFDRPHRQIRFPLHGFS
jgi:hypothetical protein